MRLAIILWSIHPAFYDQCACPIVKLPMMLIVTKASPSTPASIHHICSKWAEEFITVYSKILK